MDLVCPKCGREQGSRGGVEIHLATAHGADSENSPYPPPPGAGFQPRAQEVRQPRATVAALGVAVVALLVGGLVGVANTQSSNDEEIVAASATVVDASPAAVSTPDGWRPVGGASEGYTLALPPGWAHFPLNASTLDGLNLKELARANPALADALGNQRAVLEAGGKLFAYQESAAGSVNVNLIIAPGDGATLALVSAQVPVQLVDLGAKDLKTERVTLAGGEAVRMTFTMPFKVPGGSAINLAQVQYVMVKKGRVFIFTGSTPDRARDGETIESIARTLNFA